MLLPSELVGYEEGHAGGGEPEAGSAKLVEEGAGALNLFDFGDFVRYAVTLNYAEEASIDKVFESFRIYK